MFLPLNTHSNGSRIGTCWSSRSRIINLLSQYAYQIYQVLKDHIWTQLNLGHIVKQIYDKHKTIWWECFNVGEVMMRDDFIRLKDITYLDH
jgi:hypothetical protein